MYKWYVSLITDTGVKVKKVKANNKHEAIQKACKSVDCYRLKECKLLYQAY